MNQFARTMPAVPLMALALFATPVSPSRAAVVVTGMATVVSPPPSVAKGADPSLTTAILFEERSAFALPSNVAVDVTAPGTSNVGNNYRPSPGTIAAGTLTNIWFLQSDPTNSQRTEYIGTITFTNQILGVIDTEARLNATDPTLGHPGTIYPTGLANRALESPDSFTLSADRHTISFDFSTSTAVDDLRILVAVPEPSSLLTATLCAGLVLGRRGLRRLRRAASPVVV